MSEAIDYEAWLKYPKIDMHTHVRPFASEDDKQVSDRQLVYAGAMLGITEFWASSPISGGRLAPIEDVRAV